MQSSQAQLLAGLIFDSPLGVTPILSPHDHLYFGAFTKQFTAVTLQGGARNLVYTNIHTGESFWISPDWLLSTLLANNQIDRTGRLQPCRWYCIPNSPLVVVGCKTGELLLVNRLNHRAIIGVPEELIDLLEEPVVRQIFGHNKPKARYVTIEQVLAAVESRERSQAAPPAIVGASFGILSPSKQHHNSIPEGLSKSLQPKFANANPLTQNSESYPAHAQIKFEEISAQQRNAFFQVLKDLNQPLFGDHGPVFKFLEISKDPRVLAIPSIYYKRLAEQFFTQTAEESKTNLRGKIQSDFSELLRLWKTQNATNQKFLNNFALFREKFKGDKRFKEAQKYFDLEKQFKEGLENFKTGLLPSSVKVAIDGFLSLLRELKQRGCPVEHLLSQSEVKDFSKLSEDDKRKVFEEFRKLI